MIIIDYRRKNMGYIIIENLKEWFIYWYINNRINIEFDYDNKF
jgi:hypothetical protein